MKKRVLIPTTKPENAANYVNALRELGTEPVLATDAERIPEDCAGLLLPGGPDVEPALYGQEKGPRTETEPALDDLQMTVLRRWLETGRPVFGICRGHQLLNVYFGGTLIQHLDTAEAHVQKAPGEDNVHGCEAETDSFIGQIYGEHFYSNSSHHQAVDKPGTGLRIIARAEKDGVAEVLEHESLPVWSVQFHPERMCFAHRREDTADGSLVLRWFLERL